MVRWPPGLHAQAAKRNTSMLSWRPGFQGSGQQPITAVPVGRYSRRISSVPLTGGQAQGIIVGQPGATGTATSPTSFQLLCEIIAPTAGTYVISWSVGLAGTLSGSDADNFGLALNNVEIQPAVCPAVAGTYPQTPVTVTLNAGDRMEIYTAGNTPTTGAVYTGTIPPSVNPLTLQVGPQGMGTTWYPLSVTLSTTTGALDSATALVYLGPAATPATLQSTVFTGNGTAALAIPSMTPGQTVIAVWTGGHAGDTAALNITGTMDALSTG